MLFSNNAMFTTSMTGNALDEYHLSKWWNLGMVLNFVLPAGILHLTKNGCVASAMFDYVWLLQIPKAQLNSWHLVATKSEEKNGGHKNLSFTNRRPPKSMADHSPNYSMATLDILRGMGFRLQEFIAAGHPMKYTPWNAWLFPLSWTLIQMFFSDFVKIKSEENPTKYSHEDPMIYPWIQPS